MDAGKHKARLKAARPSLAKLMNQYEKRQAEMQDAIDVLANRLDQQRAINLSLMARLDKLEKK